ncbi:MAG: class I SAM-dependent methyltransferase [Lentisphaeraceae bacterium]|nr:class I SAM-dependent methyltransferase [Lentisphaeraceae bacterium]
MIQEPMPFNYDQAAYFYDSLELDVELNKRMVYGLLKVFEKNSVKKVWDAACGTGAQAIPLAEQGYELVASDINDSMVSLAKDKMFLDFNQGDMRTFKPGKVDAVISMMNPFGHLSKIGARLSLENFHRNLNEGGIIVGDVDNRGFLELVLTEEPFVSSVKFIEDQKYVRRTQAKKMGQGIYELYDIWFKGDYVTYEGGWDVQTWYKEELEELLLDTGFKEIEWYTRSFKPLKKADLLKSDSLLFVAKKA